MPPRSATGAGTQERFRRSLSHATISNITPSVVRAVFAAGGPAGANPVSIGFPAFRRGAIAVVRLWASRAGRNQANYNVKEDKL